MAQYSHHTRHEVRKQKKKRFFVSRLRLVAKNTVEIIKSVTK